MKKLIIVILMMMGARCVKAADALADHVYVVIINGGMNKLMNQERYWNDCAFLYRTLRQQYHIPKRNIIPIFSDGGAPGDDILVSDANGFASSLSDLDGDGERDIWLAATTENVNTVMLTLANQLTSDDQLLLFAMDHGGSYDKMGHSYLWLWENTQFDDTALGALLNIIPAGSISVVMGQCYSGGFIDNLEGPDRVIATACRYDELSWKCTDREYDEFVYHWTCAIAGHDEKGNPVDADSNADGHISMNEAYTYAAAHDRRDETPQYSSTPLSLGDNWTLEGLLPKLGINEVEADEQHLPTYDLTGRRSSRSGPIQLQKGRKILKKR